jgi:hypothetical protein
MRMGTRCVWTNRSKVRSDTRQYWADSSFVRRGDSAEACAWEVSNIGSAFQGNAPRPEPNRQAPHPNELERRRSDAHIAGHGHGPDAQSRIKSTRRFGVCADADLASLAAIAFALRGDQAV